LDHGLGGRFKGVRDVTRRMRMRRRMRRMRRMRRRRRMSNDRGRQCC